MTTTRTSSSSANAFRIFGIACHIAKDTALRRSGALKIIQPMPPSLRAIMRSVPRSIIARLRGARFSPARIAERGPPFHGLALQAPGGTGRREHGSGTDAALQGTARFVILEYN